MTDAASFDAIMQCNLLEVFCEALGAALFVTDKRDEVSFASVRLQHLFPIPDEVIQPGKRARDLYSALFDAGCRLGIADIQKPSINREEWIAERVAIAWRERVDTIEQCGPGRWLRMVSRRFPSGLGLTIFLDVSEHKKKENLWRLEQERVRLTEEVLDSLPVAVAVKDRHLNFAAVNQRFCDMHKTTPEAFLGRGIKDIFEEELASAFEGEDKAMLEHGAERRAVIRVSDPDHGTRTILHRAKRIGKPAQPYLAMTFEELPAGEGDIQVFKPDLSLRVGTAGERATAEWATNRSEPKRIVYASPDGRAPEAAASDTETCIVTSEAELAAFLPAAREAGLKIDLVVVAGGAGIRFASIAELHGIPHRPANSNAAGISTVPADPVPPPRRSTAEAGREKQPFSLSADKILVIEDNPVNRLAAEQIFGSLGLEITLAVSGREGLTRIAELRPALILADVTLPDMTFAEFADQIPVVFADGRQPVIIALLPKNGSTEHRTCSIAEIADALHKPLSPDAIDLVIRKYILEFRNQSVTSPRSAA